MFYRFLISVVVSVFLISTPAYAGFEEGKTAYDKKDWLQAMIHLRPLEIQGHDEAQLLMGNMYSNGWGVKRNYKEAFSLYRKSARKGNADAMIAVGTLLLTGNGPKVDKDAAYEWFHQAAQFNKLVAQFTVGTLLLQKYGKSGSDDDLYEAYKWFRIASLHQPPNKVTNAAKNLATTMVAEEMDTSDVERAEKEVSEWLPITKEQYLEYKKKKTLEQKEE